MLERHVKNPKSGSLLSDEDHGDSSAEMTAENASSKENLERSDHKPLNMDVDDTASEEEEEEEDESSDHGIHSDKRKSVLEMANVIEASLTISANETMHTSDDTNNSMPTPHHTPSQPQSQFWSLQAGVTTGRSSIASTLSKIKRPSQSIQSPTAQPVEPEPQQAEPVVVKTPVPEPKETLPSSSQDEELHSPALLLDPRAVSPVTSPTAIVCSVPSPTQSKSSTRTVTTRETLEGSGPRVRLTRAELLRLKAKEKQKKREDTTLKPRTNGYVNKPRTNRSKPGDYPKPWLVTAPDTKKKTATPVRTSRTSRPLEPRISTGKEPQINKLPGRRSRSKPAAMTNQTGKVRLTRAAILKLRQQQETKTTLTQKDLDNQRLGIPPVKFLEIPNSPTKINFEDDEMEHPNDIARRKLKQLFQ